MNDFCGQAKHALEAFLKLFLSRDNIPAAKKMLDQNIEWIGLNEFSVLSGEQDVFAHLDDRQGNAPIAIKSSRYAASALTNEMCLVYASLQLSGAETETARLQVSALCIKQKEDIKIRKLHFSAPGEQLEEHMRLDREREKILLSQISDIVFEWNILEDTFNVSSNWQKKFQYMPITEAVSTRYITHSHIHPKDIGVLMRLMSDLKKGIAYRERDLRIAREDGEYIWCRIRAALQKDSDGNPMRVVGVIIDIDRQIKKADQSETDLLTGLPGKGAVSAIIDDYLDGASYGSLCAFMLVDINNFPRINQRLGRVAADRLLTEIAEALRKQFREGDVVGRLGGDRFCVLMRDIPYLETAGHKAKRIFVSFSEKEFATALDISACRIGISAAPEDGNSFSELLHKSEIALKEIKKGETNGVAFYTSV